jgi:hypothetical protein
VLLGLFVGRVLAAGVAELGELKPASGGLLVLGGGVVPVLASRTLQGDDLAHWVNLLDFDLASHLGWQAAGWVKGFSESAHLTRRDTGLLAPAANPDFLFGKMCGQATHNLLPLSTKMGRSGRGDRRDESECPFSVGLTPKRRRLKLPVNPR